MLLVDDHETQVVQGRGHRDARADHEVDIAGADPPPLVGTLALTEPRMEHRDACGEVRAEAVDEGRGERDLRDEHEGRAAILERRRDRLDVDGGLPTAGDTVEQERRRVPRGDRSADPRDGLCLGVGQVAAGGTTTSKARATRGQRSARTLPDPRLEQPPTDEPRQRRGAVTLRDGRGGDAALEARGRRMVRIARTDVAGRRRGLLQQLGQGSDLAGAEAGTRRLATRREGRGGCRARAT